MINFQKKLIELRDKANLSIQALSEISGVPKSTIFNYEKNGVVPTLDKADSLLKALGATIVIGKEEPNNELLTED